jgi:hypothetical protein
MPTHDAGPRTKLGPHQKEKVSMRYIRGTYLALAFGLLLVSCMGEADPPALEALPVETVPSDWVTYTDETTSFQLSFPSDWELFEFDATAVAEFLEPLAEGSDLDLSSSLLVFGAGLPNPGGVVDIDPNLNISVETLPIEMTANEYASNAVRGAEQVFPTWETGSQSKVTVGDHEAALLRPSLRLSEVNPLVTDESRWSMVQLAVPIEMVGWTITCGSVNNDNLDICEQVVRSFRYISP